MFVVDAVLAMRTVDSEEVHVAAGLDGGHSSFCTSSRGIFSGCWVLIAGWAHGPKKRRIFFSVSWVTFAGWILWVIFGRLLRFRWGQFPGVRPSGSTVLTMFASTGQNMFLGTRSPGVNKKDYM